MTTRKRKARPRTAGVTISQAIAAYVETLPAGRRRRAASDLQLLQRHLNGYAYETLSAAERRRFERHYNLEGAAHREYGDLFGPDTVVPQFGPFLSWFLVRKVMAGPEEKRQIARESGRFVTWLGETGHISASMAAAGAALAREAAQMLPRAEQVAHLLRPRLDAPPAPDGETIEGQFLVARLAPGKLWLECYEDGRTYGPLTIPPKVSELLSGGWELSGMLGKTGRGWKVLEVWNVYPSSSIG